ncbi:MAG: S8 family serine peptidase, partial [Gaiellaceae bacterium]
PDVSAPGVSILSSVPRKDGLWQLFSGTSMASPHVAASAALLRERHPGWTVAQVKSALVLTGDPVYVDERHAVEASTSRQGGGRIALARADTPLVFAEPSSLSFGLLRAGTGLSRAVGLTDAGGGAGDWTVSVRTQSGTVPTAPATVTVPGTLTVSATGAGPEGDASGYVMLTRGTDVRRIPYWFHVEVPHLFRERANALPRTGTYLGDTRGKQSLVSRYRYPERTGADGVASSLGGPEQVFRVRLTQPAANFGVALLSVAKGVRVEPRVVFAGDENRLVGYPGLPIGLNPYQRVFGEKNLVAGAISPAAGQYDIVFDTPTGAKPGRFAFRFWIHDQTPPTIHVAPVRGGKLALAFADAGSGVDPSTIAVLIDGKPRVVLAQGTRLVVDVSKLSRGRHALLVSISDLQESKNMENVGPILPNTRTLRTTILVR